MMDAALFEYINHAFAHAWLDQVMLFLSSKGPWIAVATALVAYSVVRRDRRLLLVCVQLALGIGAADFTSYQVLKPIFHRERPCHQLKDVRLVPENCGGDYGFPSNHAANGMSVAVILGLAVSPAAGVAGGILAFLVGLSRVYLGVHFPGDIGGGFLVGAVLGALCYLVFRPIVRRVVPPRAATAAQ